MWQAYSITSSHGWTMDWFVPNYLSCLFDKITHKNRNFKRGCLRRETVIMGYQFMGHFDSLDLWVLFQFKKL